MHNLIVGIVTYHKFKIVYPNEIRSTPFFGQEASSKLRGKWGLIWGDGFDNYDVNVLRPQNNESGEQEIKKVGDKYQDKNELILHNNLINVIWNKITDMIQ